MPSADTFSVKPIAAFVARYLAGVSVDPFARNSNLATYTNDINPNTSAQSHEDAALFLHRLADAGVRVDVGLFDPPYSPRQISECYAGFGRKASSSDTQNGQLYRSVRDALDRVVSEHGVVLSFGWNSAGMGKKRNFEPVEILLVNHGGAHNDTICVAERRKL